ncbi:hypothetical protein FB567DRAFT_519192 [Paraphoma chrysanthemicola]|uniref:Uncharacterized protein n=1 Tax=Paraphoma chrysanthemicola TaxID=798071 RepID=A0A8K0RAX0_9PLEO|nr:hypothetical protein FB567DRAFT_519192 [Paraphoma chrysanthemicola]
MTQFLLPSTALACAATSLYAARCYLQISHIPPSRIVSTDALSDDFKASKAVALTNPNKHISINDSRRITITLPILLSDEQILARFVKGFFGGWWLGPERTVLRGFGKILVDYNGLYLLPKPITLMYILKASTNKPHRITPQIHIQTYLVRLHTLPAQSTPSALASLRRIPRRGLLHR